MATTPQNTQVNKSPANPSDAPNDMPSTQRPSPAVPNLGDVSEVGELTLTKDQIAVRDYLAKQEKVDLYIPCEPTEPKGALFTVGINGYWITIKKGVRVRVPKEVADKYYESVHAETSGLRDNKRNVDNHYKGDVSNQLS